MVNIQLEFNVNHEVQVLLVRYLAFLDSKVQGHLQYVVKYLSSKESRIFLRLLVCFKK